MAVPAQDGRWAGRWRSILASVLALAVLAPVGALFIGYWRDLDARATVAMHERHGVEYLLALSDVTAVVADAQSAAVSGRAVPSGPLAEAIDRTAAVDDRLGEPHRVADRWSQLRDTVEWLAATDYDDAGTAFEDYSEATDLALEMHTKMQETSGLVREDDADAYHLQDAAAVKLPEMIVAAGRLVDRITMAAAGTAVDQESSAAEISVATVAVRTPADELAVSIRSALDSTEDRTLSRNLLSALERFLAEKDEFLASVPSDGDVVPVDPAQLATLRADFQAAATDLLTALLVEIDALIEDRANGIGASQRTAAVAAVAAALITLAVVVLSLSAARRPRSAGTGAATTDVVPETRGAGPTAPTGSVPAGVVGSER